MEHFACTPNPDGGWIPQQARKLIMRLGDEQPFRFLTHGRDKVQPRLSGPRLPGRAATQGQTIDGLGPERGASG
jgi:hypothetical protein